MARGSARLTVFRPEQIYAEVNNIAPDLLVYFGDLSWRSIGTVGTGSIWTSENDTGPDDANHAQHGMFILYDPHRPGDGEMVVDASIYDIAPTILSLFEGPYSKHGRGQPIDGRRLSPADGV